VFASSVEPISETSNKGLNMASPFISLKSMKMIYFNLIILYFIINYLRR